jgi:hypothetical protein
MLQRPPKSRKAALKRARDRRYREHQEAGLMAITVLVDHQVIDWLVHSVRALAPKEAFSRAEIAAAVTEALRVSSRDW